MASRMLARTFKSSTPSRASVRCLATAAPAQPITRMSTLPSGLVVASEHQPHAQTATVGVYFDAGSRHDHKAGVAHFAEHLYFKGTPSRSVKQLEAEVENIGGRLDAYTARELTSYTGRSLAGGVAKMTEIIGDMLSNPKFDPAAIDAERSTILREAEEVSKDKQEAIFDHLHAVAFQGQALGYDILGTTSNIMSITKNDLLKYRESNLHADKMVFAGAGAIKHEELVELAQKHLSKFPTSPDPMKRSKPAKARFTGSEVRIRDDTWEDCHIAIAVEGVSASSPDYWPMMVMSSIMGNWDRSLGAAPLLSSKLTHIISSGNLANSFRHFNLSYADTGLWGVHIVTENLTSIDDTVHFTLKEWQRMSMSPTAAEVERAKSQLKAATLLTLTDDGTKSIVEDIARNIFTHGTRLTPAEIEEAIDAVSTDDIIRVAKERLWDQDIALAAMGRVEGLFDYSRIRADMSSMVF